MPIPDFQTLMLPLLEALVDGREYLSSELVKQLSERFELTETERSELLPSGRQLKITNRVHWAITYLSKCGLLERPKRGYAKITERGRIILAEKPPRIDLKLLSRFPELDRFRHGSDERSTDTADHTELVEMSQQTATPDERLRQAHSEIGAAVRSILLARVLAQPAVFFEGLVVDLLVAMGFGGQHGNSSRLGGAGDGGVDGVIDQDALGLDRVYVQAKRYTDKSIASADIRNFFGSLDAMKAAKGCFHYNVLLHEGCTGAS